LRFAKNHPLTMTMLQLPSSVNARRFW